MLSSRHKTLSILTSEPFRLFFPAGMLLGLAGVLLWPLFYAGWIGFYPGFVHTRLMIEGFAGCFIFGFLMTAGPRLLDAPLFSKGTVLSVFAFTLAASLLQLVNQVAWGDALFGLATATLLGAAIKAYRRRGDCPPPGFLLAALGLFCACAGSLLLAASTTVWTNPVAFGLGKLLLFQGFTLLPIVGVGAFFFPKILGGRNLHDFPVMQAPNADWKRRFRRSLYLAIGFFLSVGLELKGFHPHAYALRFLAFGSYLLAEIPFREFQKEESAHRRSLLVCLATIGIGLAAVALSPGYKIGWLHAYFVVGLTGIIFLVSIRVVFGHSDRPDLVQKSVKLFAWITGGLAIAAATRIYSDFNASSQASHYIYASLLWALCGLGWMRYVAPKVKPRFSS